ncbi:MAG: hypothetical protein KatS3mg001_488 [Candidatus Pacearchaeota archaeon]|nr:MAG: hypothetical protein KatS3mg001_488 [Candidatus Pacearchaeota archaeon]
MKEKIEREVVIPGEVLAKGEEYLPGEGTMKKGKEIISIRYGLLEESNKLIKVIPLSGVYEPRRGNVVIGKVEDITYYGWVIDIDAPENAFLPLQEVPKHLPKTNIGDILDIGDMIIAKINGVTKRGIDLTIKMRGLGKIEEGIIMKINPSRVPRVIGKEGSMINLIKRESGCNIIVGQNGLIWIKGKSVEDELLVKKIINFIAERSFVNGLTEEVENFFKSERK